MHRTFKYALAAGALAFAASSGASAGGASAIMLSDTCAGCHGTDGASGGPASPTIAGISNDYFVEIMQGFSSGEVPSTIMGRIAKGYSENELKAMASYFAGQKWVSAEVDTDSTLVAQGKAIHEEKCKTCHEDGGRSQEDETPRVAGQWPDATRTALEDCRAIGKRCAPKKMGKRVMDLTDEELAALADYYASEK